MKTFIAIVFLLAAIIGCNSKPNEKELNQKLKEYYIKKQLRDNLIKIDSFRLINVKPITLSQTYQVAQLFYMLSLTQAQNVMNKMEKENNYKKDAALKQRYDSIMEYIRLLNFDKTVLDNLKLTANNTKPYQYAAYCYCRSTFPETKMGESVVLPPTVIVDTVIINLDKLYNIIDIARAPLPDFKSRSDYFWKDSLPDELTRTTF